MGLRFSLLLHLLFVLSFFHTSYAHRDPIRKIMEEFSGYPPIDEGSHFPNSVSLKSVNTKEAQQKRIRNVRVSNLSLWTSPQEIRKLFFSCSDIEYVVMQCYYEQSQTAFVTFKDSQGAECAVLLSGTKLADLAVTITLAPDYQLPRAASLPPLTTEEKESGAAESAFNKAKDVVHSIIAKGYVLGKDAVNKAKALEEKHQLTSTTIAKVAFDKKIGLSEKVIFGTSVVNDKVWEVDQKLLVSEKVKSAFTVGTSVVNDKVREVDQRLQLSEKVKSAFTAAEQTVISARSAVMKNQYVFKRASWVTEAFNNVAEAAREVGQRTKERVGMAEEEQRMHFGNDKVQEADQKLLVSEKVKSAFTIGTSVVNDKVREVDQKLQVSEKVKSAFAAAEQTVTGARSVVMKNPYVFKGASWVTGAFNRVAKAAGEVGQHTKEKVGMAEEEQRRKMVEDSAQVHLSESSERSEHYSS